MALPAPAPLPAAVEFGTAYYPDHWPEAEWRDDLRRIRDAGLTSVRFGEFSWSWFEPLPGQFAWGGLDRFADLVAEAGLRLCLCTPTATPPPWFDTLYPRGRLEDMHGRQCLAARHFWCWNEPASRAKAGETIAALAARYARHPALWGWQIDNEPNYAEEVHDDPQRWYDFHPASRAAFAAWLEARHGTLDALNEAWFANFWSQRMGSWAEAAHPRGRVNPHQWLDFGRWREASLAGFVHWQRDLLRRHSPGAQIGVNIPETGVKFSLCIGQDYWAQAEGLDWVGTDLYEATGDRARDLRWHAYRTDVLRSAAGPARFFLSETQGGPHERGWPNGFAGEGFGPDYLRQCAETYAARGAEQVWWFLWRPTQGGTEIGMNGVQELDGADSPRTAVVRALAGEGAALAARRRAFLARPVVRVHYSRDSYRFRSFWWTGIGDLDLALGGWHSLLEACGGRVDFVSDAQLPAAAADPAVPLVLPFALILGDDDALPALAARRGVLHVGPQTGLCRRDGRLRGRRLPPALAAAWGADFGHWHDTGEGPATAFGAAAPGWRELRPAPGAEVCGTLGNGAPQAVRQGVAVVHALDLGLLHERADAAGRAALAGWLAPLLG